MRRLIQYPNNNYGRQTRGKTVSTLNAPRKGSKPPGISIAVRGRR